MIDVHSRESELEVQIIGLQGEIDKLKRELKETREEILADLQKAWDQTIDREINLGLQAKFHYPINDNYHALKKKWEEKQT